MSSPKKSPSKMMGQPLPSVGASNGQGAVKKSLAQKLYIPVKEPTEHSAPAALHIQKTMSHSDEAVILVSGGGGGVSGPADAFVALADRLAKKANLPTVRMDYKDAGPNEQHTHDMLGVMAYLKDKFGVSQFLVVGWSSGEGAALALAAKEQGIVAVATITDGSVESPDTAKLAPRPLLVISASKDDKTYESYGAKGDRTLKHVEGLSDPKEEHATEIEDAVFSFACKTLHKETPSK